MFPAFSKLNPVSAIADLRKLFAASTKYASLFILPAAAGIIVLSKELVYVIYGRNYLLAPAFLSLYSVSFLYAGIGSVVLGSFFNGIGETKSNLEIGVISTVIFFLAAPVLTPLYGTLGLIAAFLASSLISLLYGLYIARRKYGVGLYVGSQSRIYLAAALPTLLCFGFLRISSLSPLLNLLLGAAILTVAYLTLLPVFGGVNADDIQNLTMLFKRIRLAWPLMKHVLAYEAKLLTISRRPK
jgi:O-antigen/teichoic acid export membrane protein